MSESEYIKQLREDVAKATLYETICERLLSEANVQHQNAHAVTEEAKKQLQSALSKNHQRSFNLRLQNDKASPEC